MRLYFLLLLGVCVPLYAQTCAMNVQGTSLPISTIAPSPISVSVSGYPTATHAVIWIDYIRYGTVFATDPGTTTPYDPQVPYLGAWSTQWPPAIFGDSNSHVIFAKVYSVLQNEVTSSPLCTTAPVTFGVRVSGMSNTALVSSVSSTPGQLTMDMWTGLNANVGAEVYVDGKSMSELPGSVQGGYNYCGRSSLSGATGGWGTSAFDPTCYVTGIPHLVMMATNLAGSNFADPLMESDTFTGAASGTSFAVANHFHWNGSILTLATSGAMPSITAGGTLPSLTAGAQYYFAAYTVSGGQILITLGSTPAITLTTSTRVFFRFGRTNPQLGQNCDGYYPGIAVVNSQTSIALTALATCPTNATSHNAEVIFEPWFGVYDGQNSFGLSQTATVDAYGDVIPGPAVTLSGGSGTLTFSQRMNNPSYGYVGLIQQNTIQQINMPNYVMALMTFSTGAGKAMEGEPEYDQMFNYSGQTDTFSWSIKNTDGTLTAGNCSDAGAGGANCVYSDLGTPTGQISFSPSTQVITYNAPGAWTNPNSAPFAYGQIVVNCGPTCSGKSTSLAPTTTWIKNCGASPCDTPQFNRFGPMLSTFTAGSSFFPLSGGAEIGPQFQGATGWAVAMYKQGFLNGSYFGTTGGDPLQNLNATSCGTWSSDAQLTQAQAFATASHSYLRFDLSQYWDSAGVATFNAIATNLGFNRQACLQSLVTYFGTTQLYYDLGIDDEFSFAVGNFFAQQSGIGGSTWNNVTITGCPSCVATFSVQYLNSPIAWSQTRSWNPCAPNGSCFQTGTGSPFFVTGASNTFLNGAYLPQAIGTSTTSLTIGGGSKSLTTQTGLLFSGGQTIVVADSANTAESMTGTVTSYNSSTGALVWSVTTPSGGGTYSSWIITSPTTWQAPCTNSCTNGTYTVLTDPGAALVLNNFPAQSFQNISAIPNNSYNTCISWLGGTCGASSTFGPNLTVSGSTLSIPWTGVGSTYGIGNIIYVRLWASVNGLNVFGPATVAANSISLTYNGSTGAIAPTAGTYNSANDPALYLTVDPGLPTNSANGFLALVNAVSGHPVLTPSTLGSLFSVSTATNAAGLVSFEGYPHALSSMIYIATSPNEPRGWDAELFDWSNYCYSQSCGLMPWLAQPAMDLISVGNGFIPFAQTLVFDPQVDHINQVFKRPESIQVQMRSNSARGVVGHQLYTISTNLAGWQANCCGYPSPGTGGAPQPSLVPFDEPILFNGLAIADITYTQSERWELGLPCNHQYFGPYFSVDCHTSATWGNEVSITSSSEMPYGPFAVNTNAIAGGTLWLRQSDGNTITWTLITGNPSTLTREWALVPGLQSSIIAEPPGLEAVDTLSFGPIPASAPGGATTLVVRPTYSYYNTLDNQGFDCTNGCQIAIDHHNSAAGFQELWMNSNYQPVGSSNPPITWLPSQGLY